MKIDWDWIFDRLSENSTWRGIIGAVTASGVVISPEHGLKIIAGGMGLVAVINIFRKAPPTKADVAAAVETGDTQHLVNPDINRPKIGPTKTTP